MDLAGKPVLERVMERARRARLLDELLVATTDKPEDEAIAALCARHGWPVYRGSENDLVDRYYQAALPLGAELIVRLTADNPLIDGEIVDLVVSQMLEQPELDYASNVFPNTTFPVGLVAEVFTFKALERTWKEDQNPSWREHVTPYMYRNLDRFRVAGVSHSTDLSGLRWTLDTPQDYQFMTAVYDHFRDAPFSWRDLLQLLQERPELSEINRDVVHRTLD